MSSWLFLLLATAGAVGAALTAGTLFALLHLSRNGHLPGQDPSVGRPPASVIRRLWLRVAIGLVVAAAGLAALEDRGLLGAPPS